MECDWEEILDADGDELDDAYDHAASDALYQDHPRAAPPSPDRSADPGDDEIDLPFDES